VFLVGWVSLGSPNRVLDILGVESDEEAEDGEEHDTVGCQHQATCSTINLELDWLVAPSIVVGESLKKCPQRGKDAAIGNQGHEAGASFDHSGELP